MPMWQTICLCLPAIMTSEQQRVFAFFNDKVHVSVRELEEMDVGLFFLHSLSPEEALTVLEERRDLVIRSQELMQHRPVKETDVDILHAAIDDHIQTLLAAERGWLERTIAQLQTASLHA